MGLIDFGARMTSSILGRLEFNTKLVIILQINQ